MYLLTYHDKNRQQQSGFPLSSFLKIPGLSRTPKTFFQDIVVAQQC